jgi:hypothetical protein
MDTGPHKYHNKYHTVRTVPNSNETVAEMSKNAIPDTQIHERWVAWFATDTLMKKGAGLSLVLCTISPYSNMLFWLLFKRQWSSCFSIFGFLCNIFLSLFLWPLYCLSFFDLRLLFTPLCYIQNLLYSLYGGNKNRLEAQPYYQLFC